MTLEEQKERMITGKLYNDLTEELVNARKETVRLTDRYLSKISSGSLRPFFRNPLVEPVQPDSRFIFRYYRVLI